MRGHHRCDVRWPCKDCIQVSQTPGEAVRTKDFFAFTSDYDGIKGKLYPDDERSHPQTRGGTAVGKQFIVLLGTEASSVPLGKPTSSKSACSSCCLDEEICNNFQCL